MTARPLSEWTDEESFEDALKSLINKHSMENGSDTPDFILARYMMTCLDAFEVAVTNRDRWGKVPEPGGET